MILKHDGVDGDIAHLAWRAENAKMSSIKLCTSSHKIDGHGEAAVFHHGRTMRNVHSNNQNGAQRYFYIDYV